jgi:hypothetical protein
VQLPGYRSVTREVIADSDKELLLVLASDRDPPPTRKGRVQPRRTVLDEDCLMACNGTF